MIDISNNNPLATYPGSRAFKINTTLNIEEDGVKSSWMEIDCHHGTHIDSPSHFIKGAKTIKDFPHGLMNGSCQVISCDKITVELLNSIEIKSNVIFINFKNSNLDEKFKSDYEALSLEVCEKLINIGVDIIGTNYLSIEKYKGNGDVHRKLLSNDVWIIESLNLNNIYDGVYEYFCFPLKIETEASPIRVFIKEN